MYFEALKQMRGFRSVEAPQVIANHEQDGNTKLTAEALSHGVKASDSVSRSPIAKIDYPSWSIIPVPHHMLTPRFNYRNHELIETMRMQRNINALIKRARYPIATLVGAQSSI
jgi:hypothetical protein